MDSVALVGAALDNLAQEDDVLVPLLDGEVEIPRARVGAGELGQLVVVRREERSGLDPVGDIFGDGPGQADSVEGARSPPHLVEYDQAAVGGVVQDIGGLVHLDHEGRLSPGQVVARADPGEEPVDDADLGLLSRDEAAGLGQQGQESHLADVGGLAGHVWPGDDHDVVLVIEVDRVGDEGFGRRYSLDYRMTPLLDQQPGSVVHHGPDVAALRRQGGEGDEHVEFGESLGSLLQQRYLVRDLIPQGGEDLVFEIDGPLPGVENFVLVFLELGSDVAFAVLQGLLADVVFGDVVLVRVGDLEVVAEDLVVADLQVGDRGAVDLFLLVAGEPLAALGAHHPQLIELLAVPFPDHAAFPELEGRLVPESLLQPDAELGQGRHALADAGDDCRVQGSEQLLDPRYDLQGVGQGAQVPGVGAAVADPGADSLEVVYLLEQVDSLLADLLVIHQPRDTLLALDDLLDAGQGLENPGLQLPAAGRRGRSVEGAEQGSLLFTITLRAGQLERATGGSIDGDDAGLLVGSDGVEVLQRDLLGLLDIAQ